MVEKTGSCLSTNASTTRGQREWGSDELSLHFPKHTARAGKSIALRIVGQDFQKQLPGQEQQFLLL